jgi:hypothetical protein
MDRDSPSVLSFYIGESNMQKFERKSTKHLLFELKTSGFKMIEVPSKPQALK